MEDQIAAQLRQNIPQPEAPVPPAGPLVSTDEPSSIEYTDALDEFTRYKLQQFYGVALRPSDSQTTNRLNYVYHRVAETIGNSDYAYVAEAIAKLERILGVTQDNNRLFKTYKWLRLDAIRQSTEAEMRSYVGG